MPYGLQNIHLSFGNFLFGNQDSDIFCDQHGSIDFALLLFLHFCRSYKVSPAQPPSSKPCPSPFAHQNGSLMFLTAQPQLELATTYPMWLR
jgi:hypothetical protein